jgi:glycosyltransferase involved in cell wall biosynthesis
VCVVCRPRDVSGTVSDALGRRHSDLIASLAERFDVRLVVVAQPGERDAFAEPDDGGAGATVVVIDPERPGRWLRALDSISDLVRPRRRDAERLITDAANVSDDEVAVVLGPWLDDLYSDLVGRHRSILVAEEDLRRQADLWPQGPRARALTRLERRASRRRGLRPEIVVTISEQERRFARGRFPAADHVVVPYTLPSVPWTRFSNRAAGEGVLVVGDLTHARNADGLVEVLAEVPPSSDLTFRAVSARGLDRRLARYVECGRLRVDEGFVDDDELVDRYRCSKAVLVPAVRSTGFKTTVLQGWITGCPVVCRPSVLDGLPDGAERAVSTAATASGLVECLEQLAGPNALTDAGSTTIEEGFRLVDAWFDHDAGLAAWVEIVDRFASGGRCS